jgi:RecB family endonuclease NucS
MTTLNAFALATKFDPYTTKEQAWDLIASLDSMKSDYDGQACFIELQRTKALEREEKRLNRRIQRLNDLQAGIAYNQQLEVAQ